MLDLSTRECSTLRTLWTFQILGLERRKSISSSDFLAVLQRYWLKDWNYRKKQRFTDEQLVWRCSAKCSKLTSCSHKCITKNYKLHRKKKVSSEITWKSKWQIIPSLKHLKKAPIQYREKRPGDRLKQKESLKQLGQATKHKFAA